MHGGKSHGPPIGNKNAWKHGAHSSINRALRSLVKKLQNSS
jgi:uncharacterized protein YjcR